MAEAPDTQTNAIPPDEAPTRATSWSTLVRSLAFFAAWVYPTAWLTSRYWKVSDLVTHFQEPAAVLTLTAALVLVAGRRWAWGLLLGCLLALQCYSIYRYDGPNPVATDASSPERLRILFANVYLENTHYDELIELIKRERPDVLGFVEYTTAWDEALDVLKTEYPYSSRTPSRFDASGVSLWFRKRPLEIETLKPLTRNAWPVARATFEFEGKTRSLWVVHPFSPLHSTAEHDGIRELKAIGELVGSTQGSRIVVGDMNSTDGSAHFRDFIAVTGLRDSRHGFGRQGSWPVNSPYRIAIDHLFLSDDLSVVDRRLGPSIHSDHFPLIVDIAAASKSEASDVSQDAKAVMISP